MPTDQERIAQAEEISFAVAQKADLEIAAYRGALAEVMALAGRGGPTDPIEALNQIAERAKRALAE